MKTTSFNPGLASTTRCLVDSRIQDTIHLLASHLFLRHLLRTMLSYRINSPRCLKREICLIEGMLRPCLRHMLQACPSKYEEGSRCTIVYERQYIGGGIEFPKIPAFSSLGRSWCADEGMKRWL